MGMGALDNFDLGEYTGGKDLEHIKNALRNNYASIEDLAITAVKEQSMELLVACLAVYGRALYQASNFDESLYSNRLEAAAVNLVEYSIDSTVPECCENQNLQRTGSGADEIESWGCYRCVACGANFRCCPQRFKVWVKND